MPRGLSTNGSRYAFAERRSSCDTAAMSEQLRVGDRVRIRTGQRIFVVAEVDLPRSKPIPPCTSVVLIKPEDGKGPDQIYGNAFLTVVA
ncbi:MAG: hypothetical protein ACK4S3_06095 [Parvibaculum sp.]